MNRQIGVGDSKYVIVFDPLLMGHVIRRMRSGRVRIFTGRLKMQDLKMQDWKMTDNISANSGQNYGVWKMQDWKMTDHVN